MYAGMTVMGALLLLAVFGFGFTCGFRHAFTICEREVRRLAKEDGVDLEA